MDDRPVQYFPEDTGSSPTSFDPPPQAPQPPPPASETRSGVSRGLLVGLALVLMLAVGLAIGWLIGWFGGSPLAGGGGTTTSTQTTTVVVTPDPDDRTETPTSAPAIPEGAIPANAAARDGLPTGDFNSVWRGTTVTSEPFALMVRDAFVDNYLRTGETTANLRVVSPVTGGDYLMRCRDDAGVIRCEGGDNAVVIIA